MGWFVDDVQIFYPGGTPAEAHSNDIRRRDPSRVDFFSMGFQKEGVGGYYGFAEVSQRQYYPIKADNPWYNEKLKAYGKLAEIVDISNAAGSVPQVALQTSAVPEGSSLFPSGKQLYLTSYLAVVAGMKGIMFWEFEDNSTRGVDFVSDTQPEMYAASARVAREIRAMNWVYTAFGESIARTEHSRTVYSATWRGSNGRSYAAIVNLSVNPQEVSVDLPAATSGQPRKMFKASPGGLTLDDSAKTLGGTLQPESVYVYKIH